MNDTSITCKHTGVVLEVTAVARLALGALGEKTVTEFLSS